MAGENFDTRGSWLLLEQLFLLLEKTTCAVSCNHDVPCIYEVFLEVQVINNNIEKKKILHREHVDDTTTWSESAMILLWSSGGEFQTKLCLLWVAYKACAHL